MTGLFREREFSGAVNCISNVGGLIINVVVGVLVVNSGYSAGYSIPLLKSFQIKLYFNISVKVNDTKLKKDLVNSNCLDLEGVLLYLNLILAGAHVEILNHLFEEFKYSREVPSSYSV